MDTLATIKLYINIKDKNESNMILKSTKEGLNFIQGKIRKVDPSCIFGATRIFVKNFYNIQDVNNS